MDLYDIARQVTDEVMGEGTYDNLNEGNPDPGVQAAIEAGRYPDYADDERERLCPYCMKGMVELRDEDWEGDCDHCGRRVTFEGPEAE